MNGTKSFGTVLAVVLVVFVITPIASAQTSAGILHDQWFKVNLSLKGYTIADDGETVLGRGAGSKKTYLHFLYTDIGPDSTYTITTCVQDDLNDNIFHKNTSAAISIVDIYGVTYPQVWDLGSISLQFEDGVDAFTVHPTFFTRITAVGDTLKNATISNVACTFNAKLELGEYATGSCILNGPLVPGAKVERMVPAPCLAP
jgi:hypothetical protein